jgi:hypothetical protein
MRCGPPENGLTQGANFGPVDQKGYWAALYVREGDTWKKQLLIWNVTPAPAK